jgi:hypothetical protein
MVTDFAFGNIRIALIGNLLECAVVKDGWDSSSINTFPEGSNEINGSTNEPFLMASGWFLASVVAKVSN